ncbi:MAG: hypothetical protein GOV02_02910 [Candidatus Aenigmarchaeota archaeon]|nr:hypothetical protein [Candidatus Aenigmarchaeota archaeon]
MFKTILIIVFIILLVVTIQKCEKAGGFSEFVSKLVIDGENLLDETKGKIEEKRKERE